MNNNVSKKITHIKFLLTMLIVVLHSNCLRFIENPSNFTLNFYKFVNVICDASVPSFFLLSAYLYYRNFNFSKLKKKYESRIFSLVVPYFIWSLIFLIYYKIISILPNIKNVFSIEFDLGIGNLFNNILFANCAEGMWYVRVLIIYCVFSPLIYFVMKRSEKINYIIIGFFFLINIVYKFGYSTPIFWLPVHLIGANIGIFHREFDKRDNIVDLVKYEKYILIMIFIVISFIISKYDENTKVYYIYRQLSPILLLAILDLLNVYTINLHSIENISFFIYCVHLPIIKVIRKVLFIIFGYNEYLSLGIFVLTILLTTLCIYYFIRIFKKIFSKFI